MALYQYAVAEMVLPQIGCKLVRLHSVKRVEATLMVITQLSKEPKKRVCCSNVVGKKKAATTFGRNCLIMRW